MWGRVPSWWLKYRGEGCSAVEAPLFKLFRLYIKWSLVLKHVCAGRGNVTFGVYIYSSRPYGSVSAAFWATLKGDTLYVIMTAHEY